MTHAVAVASHKSLAILGKFILVWRVIGEHLGDYSLHVLTPGIYQAGSMFMWRDMVDLMLASAWTLCRSDRLQLEFDPQTLSIPDVSQRTAKFLGLPLPPFFRIAVLTRSLTVRLHVVLQVWHVGTA